jgi:hypothetical protein
MTVRATMAGMAAALLALGAPARAVASSAAGFRITLGKFTLHVQYSAALDYPDGSDATIRDPERALFALASLLQANAKRFAAIDHDLLLELGMRNGDPRVLLTVTEDPFETPGRSTRAYRLLGEAPAKPDLVGQLVAAVCSRYRDACVASPARRVTLYECRHQPCDGQVAFGSFPSTAVDERFTLVPPPGGSSAKVAVFRGEMKRHFQTLP